MKHKQKENKGGIIIGWIAVVLLTIIACFWAFWGTIENFHEGWWYPNLFERVMVMFIQYLSFALVTIAIGLICVRWPKIGGTILLMLGLWFFWEFYVPRLGGMDLKSKLISLLIGGLPIIVGLLFLTGRPQPRKWACLTIVGFPLLTMLICAAEPVWRIAGRIDDGYRSYRIVQGNSVKLVWAPKGPGWVRKAANSCNWNEARKRCRHLSKDGKKLQNEPQNFWRLPTVDEAVRSMARHGENCGGRWDDEKHEALYNVKPDKESPLWDTNSGIIYWWTNTEIDDKRAYIIVYHGGVYSRKKKSRMGSLGFRAVKKPLTNQNFQTN